MKPYEFLDISGDAGIRSFGNTALELFLNAAHGMYNLIMDMESVEKSETVEVSVTHESAEGLLVAWLNELIFLFDAHGFIGKEIIINDFFFGKDITSSGPLYSISASLSGEYFDPGRHHGKLLLKAATYHNLNIRNEDGRWTAEIIFDI
ncbi:MAG TPA: archease [Candidatus Sulfobium mesophilum]|nr:archease [Candidatus Sulfobium mesophilum]